MDGAELRDRMREILLDQQALVRATASGRAPGATPAWRRVELRPVTLKAGARLQVTTYSATQAFASNHRWDAPETAETVDALLDGGFGEWTVDSVGERVRLRSGARGRVSGSVRQRDEPLKVESEHNRGKERLLPLDHPVLRSLGLTTADGQVKPSRNDKVRQVDEFLRILDASLVDAMVLDSTRPLRIVDLGCGNAYLTFAAHAFLASRGMPSRVVGIDVKEQSRERNTRLANEMGVASDVTFVCSSIGAASTLVDEHAPDVVMALHACDTASDDAIAAGVRSGAALLLVAPCCHHDIQRQLSAAAAPAPYALLTRHGIVRERFGDVLTDAVRAELLRLLGYRVDVMEFVGSQHTPRNVLLRAVRTGAPADVERWNDYAALVSEWSIVPTLGVLLSEELDRRRPGEADV